MLALVPIGPTFARVPHPLASNVAPRLPMETLGALLDTFTRKPGSSRRIDGRGSPWWDVAPTAKSTGVTAGWNVGIGVGEVRSAH
jgi:hypothetical protein